MIDVSLRTAIIDLMLDLRKDFGLTYLFVTYDLTIAKYISDRTAIVYLSKIVELEDKENIFSQSVHSCKKALLEAIPGLNPERKCKATKLVGDVPYEVNISSGYRFHASCNAAKSMQRKGTWIS